MTTETISYWENGKLVTTTIKNVDKKNPYESVEITAKLMGISGFYWCGFYHVIL